MKQKLVELMSQIGFGRIEQLVVRGGEPVFDPPPRVTREFRFGPQPAADRRPIAGTGALKNATHEVLAALASIGDGTVDFIEVRHGLAFRMVTAVSPTRERLP